MKKIIFVLLGSLTSIASVNAKVLFDQTYACMSTASAGLNWSPAANTWVARTFKSSGNFIFRLKEEQSLFGPANNILTSFIFSGDQINSNSNCSMEEDAGQQAIDNNTIVSCITGGKQVFTFSKYTLSGTISWNIGGTMPGPGTDSLAIEAFVCQSYRN